MKVISISNCSQDYNKPSQRSQTLFSRCLMSRAEEDEGANPFLVIEKKLFGVEQNPHQIFGGLPSVLRRGEYLDSLAALLRRRISGVGRQVEFVQQRPVRQFRVGQPGDAPRL